jgi:hypothetical protein
MAVRLSALFASRALPPEISSGTHLCWRLQAGRPWVRDPMKRMIFVDLNNPCARTRRWGVTQPLTDMSTRSRKMFLRSRARPVRKADNLTAICEPIV